jgi:vacuolar-type H+-ATPase subunit H
VFSIFMNYLSTILDAEKNAEARIKKAEEISTTTIAHARAKAVAHLTEVKASLANEREQALSASHAELEKKRSALRAHTDKEVAEMTTRANAKQSQAVEVIKELLAQ